MAHSPRPQSSGPEPSRTGNVLLDLLPVADAARVLEKAERVALPLRKVVAEAGEPARYAYFPLTAVLSAVVPLRDGSAIEAATVGNEGMGGTDLMTSHAVSVYRMICQIEGESLRLPAADFRRLLGESEPLSEVVKRYVLALTHQSGQNAACNLRHDVGERMCRWLLLTQDRVGSDRFYLTQEFLGIMLGVRRQTVSIEAARLQEAGLIEYGRGHVTIVNRPGLEAACCECYAAIRETYRLVMGAPPPPVYEPAGGPQPGRGRAWNSRQPPAVSEERDGPVETVVGRGQVAERLRHPDRVVAAPLVGISVRGAPEIQQPWRHLRRFPISGRPRWSAPYRDHPASLCGVSRRSS